MKRFWVVMLTLGLIAAFAMPAAAVDVKVSGNYYVQGWIADNPSLLDKSTQFSNDPSWGADGKNPPTTTDNRMNRSAASMYDTRLRVNTEFKVQEGLKLVTRFDALETMWGSNNYAGWGVYGYGQQTEGRATSTIGTASQNINFSRAYMDITTGIGQFLVGYQNFTSWGNNWVTNNNTYPGIKYIGKVGNFTGILALEKRQVYDNSDLYQNKGIVGQGMDTDKEVYDAGFIYNFKQGQAGFIWQYLRNPGPKIAANQAGRPELGYVANLHVLIPTAKVSFGNLDLMVDGLYIFGNAAKYEDQTLANQDKRYNMDVSAMAGQIHAKYTFKPVTIGGKFMYAGGDDMQDPTKITGSYFQGLNGSKTANNCLILWNSDYVDAMGPMFGNMNPGTVSFKDPVTGVVSNLVTSNPRTTATYYNGYFMDNAWFYQVYADVTPMAKMNIHAALSYATADKKPQSDVGTVGQVGQSGVGTVKEFASDKYGTEFDLTVSYKIFDNLEYMVGGGYLWVGDYFKGYDANAKTKDNYLLTHKLTLTF